MGLYTIVRQFYPDFSFFEYFRTGLIPVTLGLFLSGYLFHKTQLLKGAKKIFLPAVVFVSAIIFQVFFMYQANGDLTHFMYTNDNFSILPNTSAAICVFVLVKAFFERFPVSERTGLWISRLGQCTFGAYLVHESVFIARLFFLIGPLTQILPFPLALFVLELLIFALSMLTGALLKFIPLVKRYV
jgi:hypothetical protein